MNKDNVRENSDEKTERRCSSIEKVTKTGG